MKRPTLSPEPQLVGRLPQASPEIWSDLERAYGLMGDFADALQRAASPGASEAAASELSGVITPFRCLVLAYIGRESRLGVTPGRLGRELGVPSRLLAYHLDVLEGERLIWREPRRISDRRRVSVRLTWTGAEALSWAGRVLRRVCGPVSEAQPAADSS